MSIRTSALPLVAFAACLSACATAGGGDHAKVTPTPTTQVALADQSDAVFRAIVIADVAGTPRENVFYAMPWRSELTPSQSDVQRLVSTWLADADLLAPDLAHARYLLDISVQAADGTAPKGEATPVAPTVTYALRDVRTNVVVLEKTVETAPGPATQMSTQARGRAILSHGFNEFLLALRDADMIRVRRAVPCDMLDLALGHGPGVVRKTSEAVAFNCPV